MGIFYLVTIALLITGVLIFKKTEKDLENKKTNLL